MEYITDTTGLITKRIKPNFKTLGKKYGKQMKEISVAFAGFSQEDINNIERNATYVIPLASGEVVVADRNRRHNHQYRNQHQLRSQPH